MTRAAATWPRPTSIAAYAWTRTIRRRSSGADGRSFFRSSFDAALADAERACRLDPDDEEAAACGRCAWPPPGSFDEALAAISTGPAIAFAEDIDALFYRGIARAECGDSTKALADFTAVIDLDPRRRPKPGTSGRRCYERLGDRQSAQRDLAKARELGMV